MTDQNQDEIEKQLAEEFEQWLEERTDERVLAAGHLVTLIEQLQLITGRSFNEDAQKQIACTTRAIKTALINIDENIAMDDDGGLVDISGADGLTKFGPFHKGFRLARLAFQKFQSNRLIAGEIAFHRSAVELKDFVEAVKSLNTFLIVAEALETKVNYWQAAYRLQDRRDERLASGLRKGANPEQDQENSPPTKDQRHPDRDSDESIASVKLEEFNKLILKLSNDGMSDNDIATELFDNHLKLLCDVKDGKNRSYKLDRPARSTILNWRVAAEKRQPVSSGHLSD